ncbi:MAG: ABC transporter permease, partial [Candidatus Hodarchaeota archaeon]
MTSKTKMPGFLQKIFDFLRKILEFLWKIPEYLQKIPEYLVKIKELLPEPIQRFLKQEYLRYYVIGSIIIVFLAMIVLLPNNLFTGVVLGLVARPSSVSILINHTIVFTIPIFIAALGGLYSERSGVINLALEGMMLSGAFVAVLIAYFTQSWVLGIFFGIIIGAMLGLVHAFICIHLKGDQIISGVAINILALGITNFLFKLILNDVSGSVIPGIPTMNDFLGTNAFFKTPPTSWGTEPLGFIENITRIIGYIFLEQSPLIYLAVILGIVCHLVLYHTVFGLRVRAVGEHPHAAD